MAHITMNKMYLEIVHSAGVPQWSISCRACQWASKVENMWMHLLSPFRIYIYRIVYIWNLIYISDRSFPSYLNLPACAFSKASIQGLLPWRLSGFGINQVFCFYWLFAWCLLKPHSVFPDAHIAPEDRCLHLYQWSLIHTSLRISIGPLTWTAAWRN